MDKHVSIYDQILEKREEQPSLPYLFQNIEIAGREDTLYSLLTEGLPYSKKQDLADLCCKKIREAVDHNQENLLEEFLVKQPLHQFFMELRERIRVLIEVEYFTQKELHKLGMNLTRTSAHPEMVKLGIILLGFYPHDLTLKIFKLLGYHSEFTMYVSESIQHGHFRQNKILFDLVQHTSGYGRLAALFSLKPVTHEQQKWVLKYAIKSHYLSSIYVNVSLQKVDIRNYLFSSELDETNYHDFMYVVSYQELVDVTALSEQALTFMEKLVDKKILADRFIDLAGLVTMWLKIIDSWEEDYQYVDRHLQASNKLDDEWDKRFNRYEKITQTIEEFLSNSKWQHLVVKEMLNPTETDILIVNVLQFLEIKPDFQAFTPLLKRNPLGLNLLEFFLGQEAETYFHATSDYLFNLLSEQLFQFPLQFEQKTENGESYLAKVNVWLEALLGNMLRRDFLDLEWCIKLLSYYNPYLRQLALQVLKKNKDEWEDDDTVLTALERLRDREENRKNKRLVFDLLDMNNHPLKIRKYLVVEHLVQYSLATDKKLLETNLVGMEYYDYPIPETPLKKGKLFQLAREKDNEYDKNAIGVTLENGCLLGYIPRMDNRILATLIDNGETLFARLESEDMDEEEILLQVFLRQKNGPISVPDSKTDNIVPFPQK